MCVGVVMVSYTASGEGVVGGPEFDDPDYDTYNPPPGQQQQGML